jgi:PAS domain S-box-containing protein
VKVKKRRFRTHPLSCWDIAAPAILQVTLSPDEEDLRQLAMKHDWAIDPAAVMLREFDTIVVTTLDQKIVWASRGFKKMTGYTPSYARHKRPSFLQGEATQPDVRAAIREALREFRSITDTLINYRKDGTPYRCEVSIAPVQNHNGQVVHFMALERSLD